MNGRILEGRRTGVVVNERSGRRAGLASRTALALLACLALWLIAGCGVAQTGATRSAGTTSKVSLTMAREKAPSKAAPARGDKPAATGARVKSNAPRKPPAKAPAKAPAASVCPPAGSVLAGVYHPERLRVLNPCKQASGRVVEVRTEEDGDLHINVAPDPAYKDLLIPGNDSGENGDLVVEFMARDGGHLPKPKAGDHVDLTGAYVNDLQHDWAEIHPVWSVSVNGGPIHASGPRHGGSPEAARSYNAEGECATLTGAACEGYGSGSYSRSDSSADGGGAASGGAASGGASPEKQDYDCSDFQTRAEARKYLLPGDPYRLDANHDGTACDSLP